MNYGLGSIGASAAVTDNWNPYAEAFWLSRQEPAGVSVSAVDAGAIYELGTRFALDGGVQVGVSSHAPELAVFGGLSIVIGNVLGSHGVHARERRSRQRAGARAGRSSAYAPKTDKVSARLETWCSTRRAGRVSRWPTSPTSEYEVAV